MHELFVILDHTVTALVLSLHPVPGKTVNHHVETTTTLADEPGGMRDVPHRCEAATRNPDGEIISNLVSTIGLFLDTLERQGDPMSGRPSVSASHESLFPGILTQAANTSHRAEEGLID